MHRWAFALLCAAGLLAGCVSQQRVVAPEAAAAYRVAGVEVDAAEAGGHQIRGFNLTEAEVEALVSQQATAVLATGNPGGSVPVTVDLALSRVVVPNVASAALLGSSSTQIRGTAQLRDARGAALGEPFDVIAVSEYRLGGVFGAVATAAALGQRGEAGEIQLAARNLGRRLGEAIYGRDLLAGKDE